MAHELPANGTESWTEDRNMADAWTSAYSAVDSSILPSAYIELTIARGIDLYAGGLVLVAGVIGNILSMAVLTRKGMRRGTTFVYLFSLACFDLSGILFGLGGRHWTRSVLGGKDLPALHWFYCKFWFYLIYTIDAGSSHVICAMSIERCFAILFPLRARQVLSRHKSVAVVLIILIGDALFSISAFWTVHKVDLASGGSVCTANVANYYAREVRVWSDGLVLFIIPGLIIIISNVVIIVALVRARYRRGALAAQVGHKDDGQETRSIVIMLVAVAIAYIVLKAPMRISYIVNFIFPSRPRPGLEAARNQLVWAVYICMTYTNNAINFYLYVISGREFRRELVMMLRCRGRRADAVSSGTEAAENTKV